MAQPWSLQLLHPHPCPQRPAAWHVGLCACPDRARPARMGTGIEGAGLRAGEGVEHGARPLLLTPPAAGAESAPAAARWPGDSLAHAQPRPHTPGPCLRVPPARKLSTPLTRRLQPWGVLPQGQENVLSGPTGDSP